MRGGRGACARMSRWATPLLGVCLLAGCHHKRVQTLVLPQSTPVPLATDVSPSAPVLPEPAKPKLPEVPVAEAASKPKKVRKKSSPRPATQTASGVTLPASVGGEGMTSGGAMAAPSAVTAADASAAESHGPGTEAAASGGTVNREIAMIGTLSAGDVQNPQLRQEVLSLITANERRLGSLPADLLRSQAALVSKVHTFQREAQQALDSGDAEGARTLATKGKLLLDDLTKPTS